MPGQYTVRVTIADATIEIVGDREGIAEIVRSISEVLVGHSDASTPNTGTRSPVPPSPPAPGEDGESEKPPSGMDPKSLFASKKPGTQIEATALAAYYLAEGAPDGEKRTDIDRASMEQVFRKANWKLPSKPAQVLIDAHGAGYLDRSAQGKYRLNNVGFNLVVHTLGKADS